MSNNPLINILIRVSRPELFDRCIESVHLQTYSNINLIVGKDNRNGVFEIGSYERNYDVSQPYYWNTFCNDLKDRVREGWFLIMDDDDYLLNPYVIAELAKHLTSDTDGVICQFLRNGKPKPNNTLIAAGRIEKGRIGGGCLVLHSKHKELADWQAREAADYYWIKEIANRIELKFVPLVVQVAGNNGLHGKQTPQAVEERYE